MGARAMYKAVLHVGEQRVPVKLYSALESRRTSFRLLHAADQVPVQQRMVDGDGEPVDRSEVQRAVQLAADRLVVLTDEDQEGLKPEPSRAIEVLQFLPPQTLDDRWYDRPYWLGPDGDEAAYAAMVQALRDAGLEGIAQWTMRNKRYVGALRVRGDHLALVRLRHVEEVVPLSALPAPTGRDLGDKELELARSLVDALEDEFDPEAFPETYTDRVRQLVEARVSGAVPPEPEAAEPEAESASLEDALERSLKAVGGRGG